MLAIFGAVATAAGVSVSPEAAMRSPTALACMRAISESIASLPIEIFRRASDGSAKIDPSHPAADILAGDWTPWLSGVEVRAALQMDALKHGAGYAQAVRVNGTVRELHRLHAPSVSVEFNGAGEPQYRLSQATGGPRVIPWRDMLVIATPGWTPGAGEPRAHAIVDLAREAIGLDIVMASHQARIFANGARQSGMLEVDQRMTAEQMQFLRENWTKAYSGDRSGGTMILERGMKFTAAQFSSVDLQFLELRHFAIADIARAFRVPATMIGDLQRATWRNVEELSRQFLQFTLTPWIEIWEAALSRVLLGEDDRRTHAIEFDDDDLLRADQAGRYTAFRNAVGGAFLTPNEARGFDNLPPVEGGDQLIRQAGQTDAVRPPSSLDEAA